MKSPLYKEVSPGEMLRLRDDGYSNSEIADMLDCSYQTVLNCIGKQPAGMRKARSFGVRGGEKTMKEAPKPVQNEPDFEGEQVASLVLKNRTISLEGLVGEYEIDCKGERVMIAIKGDSYAAELPFEKFKDFAAEVMGIQRKLGTLHLESELW